MEEKIFNYIIYLYEQRNEIISQIINSELLTSTNNYIRCTIYSLINFHIDINCNISIITQVRDIDNDSQKLNDLITILKNIDTGKIRKEKEIMMLLRAKKINRLI